MATLHVAWITAQAAAGRDPGAIVNEIVSAEEVTTSLSSAISGIRPDKATHAFVRCLDSAHYVTNKGHIEDASASNSISVADGGFLAIQVPKNGRIAAITHT
ncbi:hypothetical protein [uncultured Roseibium sp.]|uniref:hypothetical protein n=1 Tax=uncultured Roseibium sp. TaxID=1936171 RepID=UPI00263364B8|nr:hypothetical protein [uncultured Roseibium sp.]